MRGFLLTLVVTVLVGLGAGGFAMAQAQKPLTEAELQAYGDGEPLECEHLDEIDAARERDTQGFERVMAAVSTMTLAGFCGYVDLAEEVDERVRARLAAYDDRIETLTVQEEQQLKRAKIAYVTGRQMLQRSR